MIHLIPCWTHHDSWAIKVEVAEEAFLDSHRRLLGVLAEARLVQADTHLVAESASGRQAAEARRTTVQVDLHPNTSDLRLRLEAAARERVSPADLAKTQLDRPPA